MDSLLAIDLGSTSLKAGVFGADGKCLSIASRPTKKVHREGDPPGWVVWDPEQIWGGAAAAAKEAISKLDDPASLRAVAVTGMGMDGVPLDAGGKVLYPFISWHDTRTTPQAEWWEKTIGAEKMYAITGFPIWAMLAAMRMLWMREHEPEILAKTDRWLLIEDFLNQRLCGARTTDRSMASCMGLFDQGKLTWSDELLAATGLPSTLLPEIVPSGTKIGTIHAEAAAATGIPAGTPVIQGGQDHLCGTLPMGAFRPGSLLNTLGTWDNVITAIAEPSRTEAARAAGVCVQAHVAPDVWSVWGGTVAGESLEWFRREIGEHSMDELDAAAPGAGGVLYLPHISGTSCPVGDPRSAGSFVGITLATKRADLCRAVVEGLNYQFRDILNSLQEGLNCRFRRITAVGGGIRNRYWVRNRADVAGLPVETSDIEEATLLGAAMLAGVGAGVYSDLVEAVRCVSAGGTVHDPRPERTKAYTERFSVYRKLYPALRPLHHALFQLEKP